jgi:hypothetical protein
MKLRNLKAPLRRGFFCPLEKVACGAFSDKAAVIGRKRRGFCGLRS